MYSEEFRLALTYAIGLNKYSTGDVAMLWNKGTLTRIQGAGKVNTNETNMALPIVRLLRNVGQRLGEGFVISTTAPPTEACLGMARMCGIWYIVYLSGGQVNKITCGRGGARLESYAMSYKGEIPNVTGVQGTKTVFVPWYNPPATYKLHLRNWVDHLIATEPNSFAGKAAAQAKTLAIGGAPPVQAFGSSGLEYLGLKTMVPDQTVLDNTLMMIAFEMVGQVSGFTTSRSGVVSTEAQRATLHSGQNIGSLLSDADGNIVSWGFNTNKKNSTRHGEINLISTFMGSNPGDPLPAGGTIYTTLEPCEMCSGAIVRAVKTGDDFRVIFGQKDENVSGTALQNKVNPKIKMEESKAMLVTKEMIKSGTSTGANNKLVKALKKEQEESEIIATTQFLKERSTYETFFGVARPNWWLYLWDYMTSRITPRDPSAKLKTLLTDPEVMRVNNYLDTIFLLMEQFMQTVRQEALTD